MPGTIFSRQTAKTAIGKKRGTMPKRIIQFDDAMFETKLDAMVRDKIESIINAMPSRGDRRDRQCHQIRVQGTVEHAFDGVTLLARHEPVRLQPRVGQRLVPVQDRRDAPSGGLFGRAVLHARVFGDRAPVDPESPCDLGARESPSRRDA